MQITDTIADMLTRIRNASSAKHDSVDVPASKVKKAIAQILLDEGHISSFTVEEDGKQGMIHITLKLAAVLAALAMALTSREAGVAADTVRTPNMETMRATTSNSDTMRGFFRIIVFTPPFVFQIKC